MEYIEIIFCLNIKPEMHYISLLHRVFFSFNTKFTIISTPWFVAHETIFRNKISYNFKR